MKVLQCDFLAGAGDSLGFPPAALPEVAFMGRSNVGKSSLLNALLGRRNLARTGSTPGRTRQVNFYKVNDACLFVDLPGYGFAKVSRSERAGWQKLVEAYLDRPAPGKLAILLVDARHPLTAMDREMMNWLWARQMPFRVAATKTDKLSRAEMKRTIDHYLEEIHQPGILVPCSARTREGIPKLWAAIDGMLHETTPTH
ncbi:MAG TPA: ribosome biogenesis GTP-binding protein YihA/YsxC [Candidatus Polarisedimenticolia bacterium]|nr:ribosome biogenesis GTP-binding protein YihA/YsxC [Candidatus Polarisedimenticolia bacterium]